jgi:hypothetical protein
MKEIKGDLILTENTTFDDDLKVEGNIRCEGGRWNIKAGNIDAGNIDAGDINAWNIDARDINASDINAGNIKAGNINFYAVAVAYKSFKCKSWKARRGNYVIKCLDGEIEIKDEKKVCDKCGSVLK